MPGIGARCWLFVDFWPGSAPLRIEHRSSTEHALRPCGPDDHGDQRTSQSPGIRQRAPFEHQNVHMRPTKDLVDRMCAGQGPATGAPPGTRTPNPRIKRPKFTPSQYDYLRLDDPGEAASRATRAVGDSSCWTRTWTPSPLRTKSDQGKSEPGKGPTGRRSLHRSQGDSPRTATTLDRVERHSLGHGHRRRSAPAPGPCVRGFASRASTDGGG
jgi:hypothetical protein